jgi:hypothetical protein
VSDGGSALAVALVFVWVGLVLGISFIEAPLKFRAPGVTLQLGLRIGRVVFRALNAVEVVLAVVVAVALRAGSPVSGAVAAYVVAVLALVVQLVAVRPALSRRSDAVLAGADGPRSRAHLWYVAMELVKVAALVYSGVLLLVA